MLHMGICTCLEVYMDICADMCIEMYIDICIKMCMDVRIDMCIHMCIDKCRRSSSAH